MRSFILYVSHVLNKKNLKLSPVFLTLWTSKYIELNRYLICLFSCILKIFQFGDLFQSLNDNCYKLFFGPNSFPPPPPPPLIRGSLKLQKEIHYLLSLLGLSNPDDPPPAWTKSPNIIFLLQSLPKLLKWKFWKYSLPWLFAKEITTHQHEAVHHFVIATKTSMDNIKINIVALWDDSSICVKLSVHKY